MSENTQEQGRTFFTERDFTYEAGPTTMLDGTTVAEDPTRMLARWEIQLQEQLYTGDVTKDPVAKQAQMDLANAAPAPAPAPSPSPSPAPSPSPSPSPAPAPGP